MAAEDTDGFQRPAPRRPPTAREERAQFKIGMLQQSVSVSNSNSGSDSSSSDEETETLRQLFGRMDKDNRGQITLGSMLQLERQMARERGSVFNEGRARIDLRDFLHGADLDENHVLDFEEFSQAMRARDDPEMVPYNRLKRSPLPGARASAARQRALKDLELRRFRLQFSIKPEEIKTEEQKKAWDQRRAQRIDTSLPQTEEQMRQVFEALDATGESLVTIESVLSMQRRVAEVQGQVFDEAAAREVLLKNVQGAEKTKEEQDVERSAVELVMPEVKMDYDEFVDGLTAQGFTHEQLRTTCELLYEDMTKVKKEEESGIAELQQSLDSLKAELASSRSLMAFTKYTPLGSRRTQGGAAGGKKQAGKGAAADGAAADSALLFQRLDPATSPPKELLAQNRLLKKELKHTQEQLDGTMRMADALLEKHEKASDQLHAMEREYSDLQGKLRDVATAVAAGGGEQVAAQVARQIAERRRTHKERNQEFFFLTCLSVKLEVEAKFKRRSVRPPAMKSTKKLYEEAMANRVPFQYYHKFIRLQLDPIAKQRARRAAEKRRRKKLQQEQQRQQAEQRS